MSVKIKVALLVSIISIIAMVLLSTVSITLNKQESMKTATENQAKELRVVEMVIGINNEQMKKAVLALVDKINSLPDSQLASRELIAQHIGDFLKLHKDTAGIYATYLGLANGTMIESNHLTDEAGQIYRFRGGDYDNTGYQANQRGWFIEAVKKNGFYQTEIYSDSITGKPNFTYSYPIVKNGKLIGVVGIDIFLENLQQYFDALKEQNDINLFALDSQNIPFIATEKSYILKKDKFFDEIDAMSHKTGDFEPFTILENGVEKIAQCKSVSHPEFADFTLCSLETIKEIEAPIIKAGYVQIGLGILFALIASAILYIVVNIMLHPLATITQGLKAFFSFLNFEVKTAPKPIAIKTKDEFGQMAAAINFNVEKTQKGLEQDSKAVEQSVQTAKTIESGDFTARITETPHSPKLNELKNVLNHLLDDLQSKIGSDTNEISRVFDSYTKLDFTTEVKDAHGRVEVVTNTLGEEIRKMLRASSEFAQSLSMESKSLAEAVSNLTNLTNSQAASLDKTAQAVEEITASMQNVSSKTEDVVRQSEDIKNVIGIIRDIADQTNLLALNAAIEAARAGEHGRGFAVVADEVRKLAERTQKSLGEIEANTNLLVQSVNDMGESIKEQTAGVTQINEAVSHLDAVTQENVGIANASFEISERVDKVAQDILDDVNKKKF
ncbi:methyl-accepting chemotaxis protein [Helicobacter sp. MIT 11-5569]|uniref:methyl-accepting chemotaxis protein n=1 Tax=Helicobacter sp. MIT 11-5569 TaxID=1548151 RepID=UPI00068AE5BD|nr:methyl-accepting chemotaxis protein [Helicobacter sp. MIT 11-5569]TLD85074.1 methyl-accepting chemotaxis protein [Helicobacter sp. MIT 11-5569]